MSKLTLEEAARTVIHEKQQLMMSRIKPQMEERLQQKTMTPITAQHFAKAVDNFDKALVELSKGEDYHQAMYFFSRGCVNLGELTGRADKEKKAS